jgi:tRNA pseudouridine38-40 synthase
MRYFFEISYKGTNYHGWQIQKNAKSVQEVIEQKLSQLLNSKMEITGSGRTDTGVHAIQQYFHADFAVDLNCCDFRYHINAILPKDIVVLDIKKVKENAHARFDAISRTYRYEIIYQKDPFKSNEAYLYSRKLDLEQLNEASKLFVGKHNFKSFSKVKTQVRNFECEVLKAFWQQEGQNACFIIEANRFLRGMVRAIVGTLLMVNENKLYIDDILRILTEEHRSSAGRAVPPQGLFLLGVKYPDTIFE